MNNPTGNEHEKGRLSQTATVIKTAGDTIKALGVIGGLLFAIISFWPNARLFVEQLKSRDSHVYLGYLHGPDFKTFSDVQFDNKAWNGKGIASMEALFTAGEDVTQYVGGKSISLRAQAGGDSNGPSRLADGQCVVIRGLDFRPFVLPQHSLGDLRATSDGGFPASADRASAAKSIRDQAAQLCQGTPGECKVSVWATVRPVSCR